MVRSRPTISKGVLLSLQRRLTIFFVVIVIIPLSVAGFVVQRIVAGEISKRTELSLPGALSSAPL